MADVRVTSLVAEALEEPAPEVRVTGMAAEAVLTNPETNIIITGIVVEVLAPDPEFASSGAGASMMMMGA